VRLCDAPGAPSAPGAPVAQLLSNKNIKSGYSILPVFGGVRLQNSNGTGMVVSLHLMSANYNNSAWFYDRLSRLVYGNALISAQVYLLQFIPKNTKVLVVGGGTGWILEEIAKIHPSGLQITYVEVSAKMITQAKKRNTGGNGVIYINDAIENIGLAAGFDVALTPFLFDSFTQQTMERVFGHIHLMLKSGSLWLCADFQLTGKWWQRFLLKVMLEFFRIVCHIEATQLPDIGGSFQQYSYRTLAQKTFFNDFVIAAVYKKT